MVCPQLYMGILPRRYTEIGLLCGVFPTARHCVALVSNAGRLSMTMWDAR
jgi:hypothetical protein